MDLQHRLELLSSAFQTSNTEDQCRLLVREAELRGSGFAPPNSVRLYENAFKLNESSPEAIYKLVIWKSDDAGGSWANISDTHFGGPVGAIAIAPSDPSTIFVGTGSADPRGN